MAQEIGPAETEHGEYIQPPLRAGFGEPIPEQLLEIGQSVRAAELRVVPVKDQPGDERQCLCNDREIDAFDAAAEGKKSED